MKWIRFAYDKAGEITERFGMELGLDLHGNLSVYQLEPKVGLRSFKPRQMYERREVISPWAAETYARRLARMQAPLWARCDREFLIKVVLSGTLTGMCLRALLFI